MQTTQTILFVNSPPPQPTFGLTLEGTNLIITLVVSSAGILMSFIKIVSKFNEIVNEIRDLKEDLHTHTNSEGHEKLCREVELIEKDIAKFDKRFDIHAQDYINFKDATLLNFNGTNEKIKHTWQKTEKLLEERKTDIKELQLLWKQQNFKNRE
ncbi:hypothetical protein [Nostoc sp. 'Lobaria pulmonaria (5183) cyanobiont']|uniref:hypothetical protein n=1 Tax=Nostoc sp. 'Lobaria pulmonaria (5183) cyanobiont' TaxID=1618022 RepID=UPI000CF319C0|nr:hypothetical protein [Nostoc sp. 'Lobaria pulmonaria (5183) cyanobiont']AVH73818.1 hypothetical protein NLP_5520 [Nostoc sp. 'Lobaria pulmonaria (5183) cyanobiont']